MEYAVSISKKGLDGDGMLETGRAIHDRNMGRKLAKNTDEKTLVDADEQTST
jgi:hypothetical protein